MKTFVFIIQDEKGPILITGHKGQEERLHNKAFELTQASPPTFFQRSKKFCQTLMMNPMNYWLALSLQDIRILTKTKHSVYIMVFEVINASMFKLCLNSSSHNTEASIKCLTEVMLFWCYI